MDTEIYELAPWAGGMCTAWVRQGYRFDGCIQWMVGTKPGSAYHDLFLETGALAGDTPIYSPPATSFEFDGEMYDIPLRMPAFREYLLSRFPEDSGAIGALCTSVETMMRTKMPAGPPAGLREMLTFTRESKGFVSLARKYLSLPIERYVTSFQSPALRALILQLIPEGFSTQTLIMMLGMRMSGNAGYPMGGARGIIGRMESKYRTLGGTIHLNTKVDEIAVERGRAAGIRVNGILHPADAVVAACDVHATLKKMLGDRYRHPQLEGMLKSAQLFPPIALVSFGLDKRLGIPYAINYQYPEGIPTGPDSVCRRLNIRSFDFDPGAAPEGGSSVMVHLGAPHAYWHDLRANDIDEYRRQKKQLADAVAGAVESRIPGFRDAVRVVDVATPATYIRLAGLYKAAFEGFTPTPRALRTQVRKSIPGVKRLVLAGQWVTPGGGICAAVANGKQTAKSVMKAIR